MTPFEKDAHRDFYHVKRADYDAYVAQAKASGDSVATFREYCATCDMNAEYKDFMYRLNRPYLDELATMKEMTTTAGQGAMKEVLAWQAKLEAGDRRAKIEMSRVQRDAAIRALIKMDLPDGSVMAELRDYLMDFVEPATADPTLAMEETAEVKQQALGKLLAAQARLEAGERNVPIPISIQLPQDVAQDPPHVALHPSSSATSWLFSS